MGRARGGGNDVQIDGVDIAAGAGSGAGNLCAAEEVEVDPGPGKMTTKLRSGVWQGMRRRKCGDQTHNNHPMTRGMGESQDEEEVCIGRKRPLLPLA